MPDQPPTIVQTGFVRQRRNLLVMSLVLFVFLRSGATISVLHVFGNSITLSKPLALTLPLWMAWLYFLIRYYQYLRDLGDKGFTTGRIMRLVELGRQEAKKEFKRTFDPGPLVADMQNPETAEFDFTQVDLGAEVPQWRYRVTGTVLVRQQGPTRNTRVLHFKQTEVTVPPRKRIIPKVRAVWHLIAHTRLTTEYALPFVVAAVPLGAQVLSWIRK